MTIFLFDLFIFSLMINFNLQAHFLKNFTIHKYIFPHNEPISNQILLDMI